MRIIGCDLHAAKQTIAVLDRDTGEVVGRTLSHDGETVREFYAWIPKPAVVGIDHGLDGLVCAVDGGTGHYVPRRSSGGDSHGRATTAEV